MSWLYLITRILEHLGPRDQGARRKGWRRVPDLEKFSFVYIEDVKEIFHPCDLGMILAWRGSQKRTIDFGWTRHFTLLRISLLASILLFYNLDGVKLMSVMWLTWFIVKKWPEKDR